jgi:hypothetical protein
MMIKRCSFATGASVQQAFFEWCQGGVSKTGVFGTAQLLNSRVNPNRGQNIKTLFFPNYYGKANLVMQLRLTPEEKRDLVAFMRQL